MHIVLWYRIFLNYSIMRRIKLKLKKKMKRSFVNEYIRIQTNLNHYNYKKLNLRSESIYVVK